MRILSKELSVVWTFHRAMPNPVISRVPEAVWTTSSFPCHGGTLKSLTSKVMAYEQPVSKMIGSMSESFVCWKQTQLEMTSGRKFGSRSCKYNFASNDRGPVVARPTGIMSGRESTSSCCVVGAGFVRIEFAQADARSSWMRWRVAAVFIICNMHIM